MKRILTMIVSVLLVATLAITGSVAYLTSEDTATNVMTLGNVEIDQIEQEWNDNETALIDFTQGKPLYPYVATDSQGRITWEFKDEEHRGAHRRFSMNNVVDKYVSVENTGKSDAYVRTIFAFEMGTLSVDEFNKYIGFSLNSAKGSEFPNMSWDWSSFEDPIIAEIEVNGKPTKFIIVTATHVDILPAGETTIPSLLQVYMDKTATNEIVAKADGNSDGQYNILAVTQAVQSLGFEGMGAAVGKTDAVNALEEAFYVVSETEHPWTEGVESSIEVTTADLFINSKSDLKAAIEIGNDYDKSYTLTVNNTTVNGFAINDKGINTDTTLWANKDSMPQDKLNVVVDGVDVY